MFLKKVGRRIAISLFMGIVIAYIFIGSDLFLIKEIGVVNSRLIDEDSLWRWRDKNIFLVKVDALRTKMQEVPEIDYVVVKKVLPYKLVLEVREHIPCALLKDNLKLAVSGEGVIFPFRGEATNREHPFVIYEQMGKKEDLPLGKVSVPLKKAMAAYLSIKDIVPVEIIKIKDENNLFFSLKNSRTEIRMKSEEYEKQAYYLSLLMEELPSKNVEYIDLRFGEDVVVKP